MTPRTRVGRAAAALLVGAFALGACGGTAPSAAPTNPPVEATPAAATPAPATPAPATPGLVTLPPPTERDEPSVDPMAEYAIAAPYTFQPLDEALASIFVDSMEHAMGAMAGIFDIGFRTAVRDDEAAAWVIVMRFPDLPIPDAKMLDQVAAGATVSGGSVEKVRVEGKPARVIGVAGQHMVVTMVGDDVVMMLGTGRKATLGVAAAIVQVN